MSLMASQITSLTIVYSTVYSRLRSNKTSKLRVTGLRGIHRWPLNSSHKGPVTRKMFPFDDVIMKNGIVQLKIKKCSVLRAVFGHLLHLDRKSVSAKMVPTIHNLKNDISSKVLTYRHPCIYYYLVVCIYFIIYDSDVLMFASGAFVCLLVYLFVCPGDKTSRAAVGFCCHLNCGVGWRLDGLKHSVWLPG